MMPFLLCGSRYTFQPIREIVGAIREAGRPVTVRAVAARRGCKSARSHGDSKRWISSGSKNRAAHSGRDAAHNEETETETEPETDKQHQEQGQEQEEEEGAARYTKSSSL